VIADRLTFEPEAHRYELDGAEVLSVTTILQRAGLISFDGVPERILLAARERGTRVHKAAQFLTEGTLDWATVDETERPYVEAAARFLSDAGFHVLGQERRVYHPTHRYAGTVDLFGTWSGSFAIADYKTTAGKPSDVCADLQLAAYAEALRADPPVEWFDIVSSSPIARLGVALRKDGTYRVERYDDPRDFSHFLACLTVVRLQQQRRGHRAERRAA